MRHGGWILVAVFAAVAGCGDGKGGDEAATPATAAAPPSPAPAVKPELPPPRPPPQRPAPTEDQVKQGLVSATKTSSPLFSCGNGGLYELGLQHVKSFSIVSSNVDGDYAVVTAKIEFKRPAPFDHVTHGKGTVKFRYHWEAEWVLETRDSSGVKCQMI